ncbi:aldo/keto reductase [Pedobacter metabolipauper]|uniref:Aryl-alcohol dehydrogenase-like predicted oxidoreductase n=1 Tax=Pedobacter metabolipauper TaxID=425513 RepID=A0A4V3D0Y5_9SPHI|nr:aldo/keto reductase [Pedobacter metabolipauper]TDQ08304.1 aryl-alcohol dehydrogenase-like predicted oxidoreductase [Pedobacter metabolipauper]
MKNKLFGTYTGLPASELILGAANFGSRRGYGADQKDIEKILTTYAGAGGNFIDVADQYQLGEAEEVVGKFLETQRHNFIICTKYTRSAENNPSSVNSGNHRKAMRQGVEASLKRLKTDYIDIFMPHYDDGLTPIDEIVRGLEDLVKSGKVLYTGLANFPAWKVAAIASVLPLTAVQMEYNLVQRTADRELMAVSDHFGLGRMLYSPLAGGLLTAKYRTGASGRLNAGSTHEYVEDARTKSTIDELELIAIELNATTGQIAFAWTMTKNAFPIIGARKPVHLEESLQALEVILSPDHLQRLESVSAIEMGYPHDLLKSVQHKLD